MAAETSYRADITIVGAGVIGLAVAAQVARGDRGVYVLERNAGFGLETSSRHSGVIHSGIYYPHGWLKTRMCVDGNRMLYQLCERRGIGHRRLGKLVVATSDDETAELEGLLERGRRNGVEGLRLVSRRELSRLEPHVAGVAALVCPSSGVIDSHGLMGYYAARAQEGGARIVFGAEVVAIERADRGFLVTVADGGGGLSFTTRALVNCAGLYSDRVAQLAGIDVEGAGYRLHYCKGEYFSVGGGKGRLVQRLIYPVPPPHLASVGIHITIDIDGRVRLGPSARYVDAIDYSCDASQRQLFLDAARRLLPALGPADIEPDMAGIRPKLQGPGDDIRDFVIKEERARGLPGLINLIGIESPGLTASPAIAEYVAGLVAESLGE